jgi:hypothetical protein
MHKQPISRQMGVLFMHLSAMTSLSYTSGCFIWKRRHLHHIIIIIIFAWYI